MKYLVLLLLSIGIYVQTTPLPFGKIKNLERQLQTYIQYRDLPRAFLTETELQAEILQAALITAATEHNAARIRKNFYQLSKSVARDKRMTDILTSMIPQENNIGTNILTEQVQSTSMRDDLDATYADQVVENEVIPPMDDYDGPQNVESKQMVQDTVENRNNAVMGNIELDSNTSGTNEGTPDIEAPKPDIKHQEEENTEQVDEPQGIAGIVAQLLGSILNPEGGIDVRAVTGLIGSLSELKPDGTYDFTGLQNTLGGLLGGGEGGGGSDVGLFVGGLASAVLRGLTNQQGGKTTGRLLGNIFLNTLPGLSAFPQNDEDSKPPPPPLDSGGFFAGIFKSILGGLTRSSGGGGGGEGGGNHFSKVIQFKNNIFRTIFSLITAVFGASSACHHC